MNNEYRRSVCVPCENASSVSYRPIEKFSIYSFDDLCKAFANGCRVDLEGRKGVITSLKRFDNTPSNSIIVTMREDDYGYLCDRTVRIK
jgi:hypothetical protein